jgi:putative endonuclease
LRGYRLLATNCWAGGYELDLVVRRGRALVFVEVKSKAGGGYGDPLDMVTPLKVERLRRAAEAWLGANRALGELRVRFDVAAERAGRMEVVQDAF